MVAVLLEFFKAPMKQPCNNFFFLLVAVQEFFSYVICAACNFFFQQALAGIFNFKIPHPPQKLKVRPLMCANYLSFNYRLIFVNHNFIKFFFVDFWLQIPKEVIFIHRSGLFQRIEKCLALSVNSCFHRLEGRLPDQATEKFP